MRFSKYLFYLLNIVPSRIDTALMSRKINKTKQFLVTGTYVVYRSSHVMCVFRALTKIQLFLQIILLTFDFFKFLLYLKQSWIYRNNPSTGPSLHKNSKFLNCGQSQQTIDSNRMQYCKLVNHEYFATMESTIERTSWASSSHTS